MKKRAEVLSFFLRMNGCMVDELTVYEKFIRHSMPHSLRCISDILDSLSIAHHITQGIHPPADTNKRVALFFPENEQPLWIPSRTGKTSPPHSRDTVYKDEAQRPSNNCRGLAARHPAPERLGARSTSDIQDIPFLF